MVDICSNYQKSEIRGPYLLRQHSINPTASRIGNVDPVED